jgi:hypothetical protein
MLMGGALDDQFDGGAGSRDEATYIFSETGVSASLASGTAQGQGSDRLRLIERLTGSELADVLIGNGRPNLISGRGGNDRISGAGNDDFLSGGEGSDVLNAAAGRDYCLDNDRGRSCEITGLPSARPTLASNEALALLAGPQSSRVHDDLGTPVCGTGGVVRASFSALRPGVAAAPPPGKRKRHTTSVAPPQRVRAPNTRRALAALLRLRPSQVRVTERVTWRGVLFRFAGKRRGWVRYRSTIVLTAVVDPSRAATWSDARGRPVKQIDLRVPPGRYAWAADLRPEAGARIFDWIEPHVKAKGAGVFRQTCDYSAQR